MGSERMVWRMCTAVNADVGDSRSSAFTAPWGTSVLSLPRQFSWMRYIALEELGSVAYRYPSAPTPHAEL
jgi:hypothetical protein